MIHYCPECEGLKNKVEAEVYRCKECNDTYCVHFMKKTGGPGAQCLVCGSEKRKEKAP